ncbi:ATP synthase F0 subunit a (mitochondrion) [Neolecta irregularis DAH-3]|uniref:ATP synthase subunit a n=1 Tax=Neolecta irregularis (strain DAH-3) TaxID=1198029 RepID=A0A1U7LG45_NEOID|nr:ATP synthase F0 subunit a [Neolecta irregularis DAH-3]|eukprot:OLL21617.1 ATP synthase F0 subunit a (mitochondrion) [Neolecta irregularis DAH-3]
MVTYSFTLTAHLAFSIGVSTTIMIAVTILGLKTHGLKFFNLFLPGGTPTVLIPFLVIVEALSYSVRCISLGARLSANLISGHSLLTILGTFLSNRSFLKTYF